MIHLKNLFLVMREKYMNSYMIDKMLHQLSQKCDNNYGFILDLLNELKQIFGTFGKIDNLIHDLFEVGEYNSRVPSPYGLYKVRFVNGYYSMDISEKLDLNSSYSEKVHHEINRYILLLQNNTTSERITSNRSVSDNSIEIKSKNKSTDLKNLLSSRNLNKIIDNFMYVTQGYTQNSYPSTKIINQMTIQWMLESHIMHDFGLYENSCNRILGFLYQCFKSKNDGLVCVALSHSIRLLLKKSPLDYNINRLLKELYDRCEVSNSPRLFTYGKFIEILHYQTPDLLTLKIFVNFSAVENLKTANISNLTDSIFSSLIRAQLWYASGYLYF
ncbi:hypothetical protein HZS_7624 [Henneguya salminicola]|nr:hypothetical protein HZS_7624 [Henneguya salminicola]